MSDAAAECDIAVVGGGLLGVPLALALATDGHRVTLLERRAAAIEPPLEPLDQRCTALAAGSVRWLEHRGLWPTLSADACPIRSVHVSQRGRFGAVRMRAAEQGLDTLGHVLENRVALNALEGRLADSGVHRIAGVSVREVRAEGDGVELGHVPATALPGGDETAGAVPTVLRARLVIGVDGTESDVRSALGIGVRRVDYRQSAVLGTVALGRDHDHVAFERFTDAGPLALLPRPGRVASFVECAEPADAERLAALDEAGYLAHLQGRFGRRLGRFRALGPRVAMPLWRIEARRQVLPRAVLLGNAARLLHPIAGQGYNLALRDAATLVTLLASAPAGARDDDPGDAARLAAFAALRRADQRRTVGLTDALARVFRGRDATLSHVRALGLIGLDAVPPLRRGFARAATGLSG